MLYVCFSTKAGPIDAGYGMLFGFSAVAARQLHVERSRCGLLAVH